MFYRNEPQAAVLEVKSYMVSCISITIKPLLTNKYLLLTINYLIQTLYVFGALIPQKLAFTLEFMTVCSPREVILFPINKDHHNTQFICISPYKCRQKERE